jgi:hypothetical protein
MSTDWSRDPAMEYLRPLWGNSIDDVSIQRDREFAHERDPVGWSPQGRSQGQSKGQPNRPVCSKMRPIDSELVSPEGRESLRFGCGTSCRLARGGAAARIMNPDVPDDVEIGYSSSRMLSHVALAATMTLLRASIAVSTREYRRRKFVALKRSALAQQHFITTSWRAMLHAGRATTKQTGAARLQRRGAPSQWIARCT